MRRTTRKSAAKKPVRGALRAGKSKSVLSLPTERTVTAALARDKQKGLDAIALVRRRLESITEAFYDIALALQVLQRKPVYVALGASTFDEVIEEQTGISRSLAYELVKIPAHLSREAALHLGREKASALISYVEATHAPDVAEELARDDGKIGGKPVSALSAQAIEEKTRKVRPVSKGHGKRAAEEHAAQQIAHELEMKLEKHAGKGVKGLVVVPVRHRDGWYLKIEAPVEIAQRMDVGGKMKMKAKRAKGAKN